MGRRLRLAVIAIAVCMCGRTEESFSADEVAIYRMLFDAWRAAEGNRTFVLWSETNLGNSVHLGCLDRNAMDDTARADFRAKNRDPRTFTARDWGDRPIEIATRDDLARFIRAHPDKAQLADSSPPHVWEFNRSFGSMLLHSFSRIGFSADSRWAVLYWQAWGPGESGWGSFVLFERVADGWVGRSSALRYECSWVG